MKTPIVFTRTLKIEGWNITGEIGFARKREIEPLILLEAVTHGMITPEHIARVLLDGRLTVARRLVEMCTRLELLVHTTHGWTPTEAGRKAAVTEKILLPERGTWTIWTAQDPFLSTPVLGVTLWKEPSTYEERRPTGGRQGSSSRMFEEIPVWLKRQQGRAIVPILGGTEELRINEIGHRVERISHAGDLRLHLTIAPDCNRLDARGVLANEHIDCALTPPCADYDHTLWSLLAAAKLTHCWDNSRRKLCVSFEDTNEHERTAVERSLRIPKPVLDDLGTFETLQLDHLPLRPRSPRDAERWTEWRMLKGISGYPTECILDALWRTSSEGFADMIHARPPRTEIAARLRSTEGPSPTYWQLQAPADWNLNNGENS